jgi:hypothetical protein
MGQLSVLRDFLISVGQAIVWVFRQLARLYQRFWAWLRLRLPFVEGLARRHLRNPVTVFVDAAIVVLTLYFAFGITAYVLVYPKQSESRFTEGLSQVYPLPAARVDNSFIWSHQFLTRLRYLTTFTRQAPKDTATKPPSDQDLRSQILAGLIENRVIYLEAKKRGLSVTQSEVTAAFAKQGQPDEIATKIKQLYGMNLTQFKEIIAEQVLKEKVKAAVLTRVHIRHILTSNLTAAQQAKQALADGRPFADVAKEFSQDAQTKDTGGDLSFWYKGELSTQISPGFEEAVFALNVNQVSDPIQSKFGFHIVEVTEKTGDSPQTYDDWLKQQEVAYKIKRYIAI